MNFEALKQKGKQNKNPQLPFLLAPLMLVGYQPQQKEQVQSIPGQRKYRKGKNEGHL